MTGLVLSPSSAAYKRMLKNIQSQLGQPPAPKPAPRANPKFLPGETRATVGIDGFQDKKPAPWSDLRNLTKPQFIGDREPPRGISAFDPHSIHTLYNRGLERIHRAECFEHYLAQFLLKCETREYWTWRVNGWHYCELMRDISPREIRI